MTRLLLLLLLTLPLYSQTKLNLLSQTSTTPQPETQLLLITPSGIPTFVRLDPTTLELISGPSGTSYYILKAKGVSLRETTTIKLTPSDPKTLSIPSTSTNLNVYRNGLLLYKTEDYTTTTLNGTTTITFLEAFPGDRLTAEYNK